MVDIFISYARADLDRVIPVVKSLEEHGWSTFWDWRSTPVGKTWRQFINEGINEARCVLVVWSEKSIDSEWVIEEADHGKINSILVPICIDDVLPPFGFRQIQAATLFNWACDINNPEFVKLMETLESILGPPIRYQQGAKKNRLAVGKKIGFDLHPQSSSVAECYVCTICAYIYDPRLGDPDGGISPGTQFPNIPDDWECPVCGGGKNDFDAEDPDNYGCTICAYIYDPRLGDPDGGISPGTQFPNIPDDWECPVCGGGKNDFEAE